jgi:hypothetical protein
VVTGSIDTSGTAGKTRFVQIYGLERLVAVQHDGRFTLSDLPADTLTFRIASADTTQAPITDTVATQPGDTITMPFVTWMFSKKIVLNTSSSGAGVEGDVYGFPVLLRLKTPDFFFGSAGDKGQDLRFSTSSNRPLSYEIERWDPAAGIAEIWVLLDTVHGNNASQFIVMRWGNQGGVAISNGPAVFDTATGFQGVWHLNQPTGSLEKDATYNHFDGTPSDTAPLLTDGPIGAAKQFNGVSSFIDLKSTASGKLNFQENATYTISAWAYADTLDDKFHAIVGKSDNQYFLKLKQYYPPNPMRWEFAEFHNLAGWEMTDTDRKSVV